MTAQSIRTRLTIGYLIVLATATAVLAAGAWALFRESIVRAADATLAERVHGTARFIDAAQRELPPEELRDEFVEFAELTSGETLLEVVDDAGQPLNQPLMPNWDRLRAPASPLSALRPVARTVDGRPYRAVSTQLTVLDHRYDVHAAVPMATEYAALRHFGWLLAALVPGVLLLAGVGGFWLSGRALAPVDRMTRDVQAISLRALSRRLDVPAADDELRRLAVTFNDMLARLESSVADMARFTAEAAHELRTPVSLTRASAEIALSRDRSADDYRKALSEVLTYAVQMSSLVTDLLTLARADAGVDPAPTTVVDLREAAAQAARDVQPAMARRGHCLTMATGEAPVFVRAHDESLRRLALILLDNAAKYTPPGGAIGLRIGSAHEAGGTRAVLEVTDTGPGILVEDGPHVFDRFYRGAEARQQAPEGSGLGLSIAQTIVERLGGTITIGAGPGGAGCRVAVAMPSLLRPDHQNRE